VAATLARTRDDLLNDDELRGAPGAECVRRVDAIDALLEQVAAASPSDLGGVRVSGDAWELQDFAYSVMRAHFDCLGQVADLFWTGRIDVAEMRAGIDGANQYLDLVQSVGTPERPSCINA